MENIIIYGAGGLGREIVNLIEDINLVNKQWNILGYIDDINEKNKYINGYRVLGGKDYLEAINEKVYMVIGIGECIVRKNIIESIENPNIIYPILIHPTVYCSRRSQIGEGTVIAAHSLLSIDNKIGNHVFINCKCNIGHDVTIEDYSCLNPNTIISGNSYIEEGVFTGSSVTIIPKVRIGRYSVIGSASNVIKDLPENCTAVGNPAKPIKFRT